MRRVIVQRDQPTRRRPGCVPELDGVRGLTVPLVMGNHTPLGLAPVLPEGFIGVDIFSA